MIWQSFNLYLPTSSYIIPVEPSGSQAPLTNETAETGFVYCALKLMYALKAESTPIGGPLLPQRTPHVHV